MSSPPLTWDSFRKRTPQDPPLIMAHRGASDDLPENTLAAFALALEQGAQVLETDIRFTRDDQIVLMHDATVERTMNDAGAVSEMTLAKVKKLRARRAPNAPPTPFGEAGLSVPTLAEFLQFTPVPIALELKDERFANAADAARLIDVLAQHNAIARCVLISFQLDLLQRIKALSPQIPIGMITLKNPFPLYPTEFIGPLFPLMYLNPLYVWWARKLGKLTCPLDPTPEARIGYY